ncbi:P-loop containing nucleoside triphosphate hydrolase protein [Aulographum hederae CBS 113979]|uniref:GTP-binding protein 8 n=1 Tax=Aulographum hederae CBS 113979 TaxID=1176131 RepID=A0A6G1GTQ6_9PEZI|nr:P-loop containing nucleoside triphosphate hydrolase protein [Aulographum hederae CBS 113979]
MYYGTSRQAESFLTQSSPRSSNSTLNSYWDTTPPTQAQLDYAHRFFTKYNPTHVFSAAKFRTLPMSSAPEVAFLGRSNVGKSSLLNALFNRTKEHVAWISSKPGRTREMNAFGIGSDVAAVADRGRGFGKAARKEEVRKETSGFREFKLGKGALVVVDMPGYGKASRQEWGTEILKYLTQRKQMRRAFLLVDAEHGLKIADKQLLEIFRQHGVPHQIILSKADKILYSGSKTPSPEKLERKQKELEETMGYIRKVIQPTHQGAGAAALGEIIACSAEKTVENYKKLGIDGVRWAVLQATGLGNSETSTTDASKPAMTAQSLQYCQVAAEDCSIDDILR